MKINTVKKGMIALALLIGMFLIALPQQAVSIPLNLTLNPPPDIYSEAIDVNYVYDTADSVGNLTAFGEATSFYDGTGYYNILNGIFALSAITSDSGTLIDGNLAISGTVQTVGYSGDLLRGNLTAFGFDGLNDPFEFLFDITGGSMAGLFSNNVGGVILSYTGFGGSFNSNFSNTFQEGVSDTAPPVPEPATFALLLIGLPGIFVARKWGWV